MGGLSRAAFDIKRQWGRECVQAITGAIYLTRRSQSIGGEELKTQQLAYKERLSSLLDEGRLFFLNAHMESFDLLENKRFSGYRPDILDTILNAYHNINDHDELWTARKMFISELQKVLEPTTPEKRLRKIMEMSPSPG